MSDGFNVGASQQRVEVGEDFDRIGNLLGQRVSRFLCTAIDRHNLEAIRVTQKGRQMRIAGKDTCTDERQANRLLSYSGHTYLGSGAIVIELTINMIMHRMQLSYFTILATILSVAFNVMAAPAVPIEQAPNGCHAQRSIGDSAPSFRYPSLCKPLVIWAPLVAQ